MGLLTSGTPLMWTDAMPYLEQVKRDGMEQLIEMFARLRDRTSDCLRWGDEVEYILVKFNDERKTCHVTIRAGEVLETLEAEMKEKIDGVGGDCRVNKAIDGYSFTAIWHPEFGRYMLEGTPARPYRQDAKDLLCVERDMIMRRRQVEALLRPGESLLAIGNFPRLGCKDSFDDPLVKSFTNDASRSLFFPDEFINTHPRFKYTHFPSNLIISS